MNVERQSIEWGGGEQKVQDEHVMGQGQGREKGSGGGKTLRSKDKTHQPTFSHRPADEFEHPPAKFTLPWDMRQSVPQEVQEDESPKVNGMILANLFDQMRCPGKQWFLYGEGWSEGLQST